MKILTGTALLIALAVGANAMAYNPTKPSSFVPRGASEPHATLSNKSGYSGKARHASGRAGAPKAIHQKTRREAGSINP
jgi:hypothetical protein